MPSPLGFLAGGLAQGFAQGALQGEQLRRQKALQDLYAKHQGFQESLAKEQMYMKPYETLLGRVPGAAGPLMGGMEEERKYRANPEGYQFSVPSAVGATVRPGSFDVPEPEGIGAPTNLTGQEAYGAFQNRLGGQVAEAQRRQMMLSPEKSFYDALARDQAHKIGKGNIFEQAYDRTSGTLQARSEREPALAEELAVRRMLGGLGAVDMGGGRYQLRNGTVMTVGRHSQAPGVTPGDQPPAPESESPGVERMPTPQESAEIRQLLEFQDHAKSLSEAMKSGKMPVGGRLRTLASDVSGEIGATLGFQTPILASDPELNAFRKWLMQDMINRARQMGGVRMAGSPQMYEKYDVKNFPNLERMDPATIQALAETAVRDADIHVRNMREVLKSQGKSTALLDQHVPQIQTPEDIMGHGRGVPSGQVNIPGMSQPQEIDPTDSLLRSIGAMRR